MYQVQVINSILPNRNFITEVESFNWVEVKHQLQNSLNSTYPNDTAIHNIMDRSTAFIVGPNTLLTDLSTLPNDVPLVKIALTPKKDIDSGLSYNEKRTHLKNLCAANGIPKLSIPSNPTTEELDNAISEVEKAINQIVGTYISTSFDEATNPGSIIKEQLTVIVSAVGQIEKIVGTYISTFVNDPEYKAAKEALLRENESINSTLDLIESMSKVLS